MFFSFPFRQHIEECGAALGDIPPRRVEIPGKPRVGNIARTLRTVEQAADLTRVFRSAEDRGTEDVGRARIDDEAALRFGVSETTVNRCIMTLTSLRNTYPAIVNALNRRSHIESELAKRKADITAPELTLTEKPPYSLKYYDAYIDQLDDLSEQIEDAQYDLDHAASAAEQTRCSLR